MREPDWDFWGNLPTVELWQAVLLSLNFDPDEITRPRSETAWEQWQESEFGDADTLAKFEKRLRLLQAHRDRDPPFSRPESYPSDSRRTQVRLDEFAVWAIGNAWEVPKRFFSLMNGALPRIYGWQDEERKKAGRWIIDEAIGHLAQQTGWARESWTRAIHQAIESGQLPLRNPQDWTNPLPYEATTVRDFYDCLAAQDLDLWLTSHPEWNVQVRFTLASGKTSQPPDESQLNASRNESSSRANGAPPWTAYARNLALQLLRRDSTLRKLNELQIAEKVRHAWDMTSGPRARGGKVPTAETIKRHALRGIKAEALGQCPVRPGQKDG
jgi:hypothetical protein